MGTLNIMDLERQLLEGFHSINVPSEWGLFKHTIKIGMVRVFFVSIQLMSPASGDQNGDVDPTEDNFLKFPFN